MPLTPIILAERKHDSIPLASLLRGTELDLFPEVASGKYVSVRILRDRLDLQATKYVGYIPLNSRFVLHVLPEFGISNLLRLLAESKGDSHALEFFDRTYRSVFDPNRTLIDFPAMCLNCELRALARGGMWREYLPRLCVSAFPAGKILPNLTVLRGWSRGDAQKLYFERFELCKDIATNRLIKYAVWLLTSPLTGYATIKHEITRSLNEHLHRFQGVRLDHSLSFIPRVERLVQTGSFPRTRPYYARLCRISLYVLRALGLDILHAGAEATLPSFVVDLETVFENYVLRILQRELSLISEDVRVLDGNSEGARELFVNRRGYPMTPDIVVVREDKPLLVADVKYKEKPGREDRSQVVTYAVGYGTSRSLLICPASGGQRQGLRPLGLVNNQIQVDEYYFDLGVKDLTNEDHKLACEIASAIGIRIPALA